MNAPANRKAARRLETFKRLLAHIRELLSLDLGIVLWDGSTVPANLKPSAFSLVIADEGVIAALIRRPNLDTFLNLWVAARIDVRNGTVFDLFKQWPKMRTREIRRGLNKKLALATAMKFLFVPRGGPWPLENIRGHEARKDGSEKANKENIQYHYDLSNAFYALFLDPEMVYTCAYFSDWNNDLATAQRDKLDMICRKLRLQPGERLLDIGCGWGALVCHAAKHYGVRAVGVTLAEEQFKFAKEKVSRLWTRGQGDDRVARLFAGRGRFRQDRLDRHVRACRRRQLPYVFPDRAAPAEAGRALPAPLDRAALAGLRATAEEEDPNHHRD